MEDNIHTDHLDCMSSICVLKAACLIWLGHTISKAMGNIIATVRYLIIALAFIFHFWPILHAYGKCHVQVPWSLYVVHRKRV